MKIEVEKDLTFHINKRFLDQFINCVRNASPNEASGLIFGKVEQSKLKNDYQYHYNAFHFECIESNHKSPVAFLLNDNEALYQMAYKIQKQQGLQLIAVFHSHPSGTTPSSVDYHYMKTFFNANIPKFKHLIWIIMDSQNNELKAFMIFKGALTQIQVKLD